MSGAGRWVENRPASGWRPRLDLRHAWAYREVGLILALRDIKVRYQQTFFGVAWAVLQPLLAMVVFTLVLGGISELSDTGVPYSAFVIVGLAIWYPYSSALAAAADSLVAAPELVDKTYFPRILAPLGAILAVILDLAVAFVLALVVAVVAGATIEPTAVLLPLCVVPVVLAASGLGLWLAALNVLYRDVRYAVPFLLQLMFFAGPVLYRPDGIDDGLGWVFALNPVSAPVELTRWAMLGTDLPGRDVAISLATTAVLVVGGIVFFRRAERQFADRI